MNANRHESGTRDLFALIRGHSRLVLFLVIAAAAAQTPAPLAIVNAHIHEMEDGADVPPGFTFVSGQTLFLDFQIEGFQVSANKEVRLECAIESLDPHGVAIMEPVKTVADTTLSEQDKTWKPKIRQQINIPPIAIPGTHKIIVRVKDNLNGQSASKELTFDVRARTVEPSPTLTVRNFHFYRGEDDPNPLANPVYRPGDTLWARFDIVGYKLGEGNQVDLDYGIAVTNAAGKVLFSQPNAAVEKSSSFYPKPYVPGSMNLSLEKNIRPGQYGIVITVRDHTGNQNQEAKQAFSVEP